MNFSSPVDYVAYLCEYYKDGAIIARILLTILILLLVAQRTSCPVRSHLLGRHASPREGLCVQDQLRSITSASPHHLRGAVVMESSDSIDVLMMTAHQMQERMTAGKVSSEQLVLRHLQQIEKYNGNLCLLIEVSPTETLIGTAGQLDTERGNGHVRGAFHGIPIIVKVFPPSYLPGPSPSADCTLTQDNFVTEPGLGLRSTGGSFAFMDLKRQASAKCIRKMTAAGCMVMGKANLSVCIDDLIPRGLSS